MKIFKDKERNIYRFLAILGILCVIVLTKKIVTSFNDQQSFRSVSRKPFKNISDKTEALNNAYGIIEDISSKLSSS